MALNSTTLTNAITALDDTIVVGSVTGAVEGGIVKLGSREYAFVVSVDTAAKTVKLRHRGSFGGTAIAHAATVPVIFANAGEMPLDPAPGRSFVPDPIEADIVYVPADATLPAVTKNTTFVITKGSAAAITLAAPSAALDGLEVIITSASAYAHTVTYAAGFLGGTTSNDVATFTNIVGHTLRLVAVAGVWRVVGTTPLAANSGVAFA
jgi:hypothetical protein